MIKNNFFKNKKQILNFVLFKKKDKEGKRNKRKKKKHKFQNTKTRKQNNLFY